MANENQQPRLKSTCKRVKEFDFTQEVIIDRLSASADAVNYHAKRMKETFPNISEQELWQKINAIIIRDNVFNAAMQKIVPCYEITIDQEELSRMAQWLKNNNPSLANAPEENLRMIGQRLIEKQLVFEDVQKLWNITVTNEEVLNILRKMYEETNHPIRDIVNDQAKIDALKPTLLEQKTADVIISHLKYKLDENAIRRNAEEAAKANMAAAAVQEQEAGKPADVDNPKTEENK